MKRLAILLLLFWTFFPFLCEGAKKPLTSTKGGIERKKSRNVSQTLDSIHWLVERHCDNKTEKSGRDDGTIDIIKKKFQSLPPNTADSLLKAQYGAIVKLFEEERNNRAFALTDCYYALAKDDDPNLGPLYLNDMVLAIERNDSILLRTRMNELRQYADRNNLDYDQDLEDGEINMRQLRQRLAFRERPFDDFLLHNGNSVFWVLDMSEAPQIPAELYSGIPQLLFLGQGNKMYGKFLKVGKDKEVMRCYGPTVFDWPYKDIRKDDESKHYFASYSTERGGTSNPELIGSGRQLVQNLHAKVSGELARKKYSAGKRLGGEMAATLIDVGLNALFSYLSVTTQHAYTATYNLTMTQPGLLEGEIYLAHVAVKSNNPGDPKITDVAVPVRYYKMPYEGDLYLITDKCEPVYSAEMRRSRFEELKSKHKLREKEWNKELSQWKKENKGVKPKFEKYYEFHNDSVMNILREKAESSLETVEL